MGRVFVYYVKQQRKATSICSSSARNRVYCGVNWLTYLAFLLCHMPLFKKLSSSGVDSMNLGDQLSSQSCGLSRSGETT